MCVGDGANRNSPSPRSAAKGECPVCLLMLHIYRPAMAKILSRTHVILFAGFDQFRALQGNRLGFQIELAQYRDIDNPFPFFIPLNRDVG